MAGEYRECIGRYELTLPGKVDVATTTPMVFGDQIIQYPIQFLDGQMTKYSSFVLNGEFRILQGVSDSWARDVLKKRRDFVANSKRESNGDKRFSEVATGQPDSFAMSGSLVSKFYIYKDGRFVGYTFTSFDDGPAAIKKATMDWRIRRLVNVYADESSYARAV
ncbi:hypothetical protein [Paraburkholderia terrae]